ncbi:MAG: PDZ domain-containing protein, partial [Cupriavidus sp.]|nr:PDZ domain-containing protein [Cupriavidus sp.]
VAKKVEQQLVAHGKVTRGRLGISVQEVNQALAQSFKLPKPAGALVNSVEPDSPAAQAGVKPGDVIVQLGNDVIDHSGDLPEHVADLQPGTKTDLKVIRKGDPLTLSVKIGAVKESAVAQGKSGGEAGGRLGLAVRPLTPAEKRDSGIDGGLVVVDVAGPAARVGIQPGDVILSLNGTPISSAEQLRALVTKSGKQVALLVQRDDARIFIPLDLG